MIKGQNDTEQQDSQVTGQPEQEIAAENAQGAPVPDSQERPVGLIFFAETNAFLTDKEGNRSDATELMGAFVYQMHRNGRLADTETNYRRDFNAYCGL